MLSGTKWFGLACTGLHCGAACRQAKRERIQLKQANSQPVCPSWEESCAAVARNRFDASWVFALLCHADILRLHQGARSCYMSVPFRMCFNCFESKDIPKQRLPFGFAGLALWGTVTALAEAGQV